MIESLAPHIPVYSRSIKGIISCKESTRIQLENNYKGWKKYKHLWFLIEYRYMYIIHGSSVGQCMYVH